MPKYFNSEIEHSKLIAKLKEFRLTNEHLNHLKDYQIAEQIGWTNDKFSKALNLSYSIGISMQLRDIFIKKFNADPAFFTLDLSTELQEMTEAYELLLENYQLLQEITEAQQEVHKIELNLHNLRLEKLKNLSQTDRFKKVLHQEQPNDVLHTILRIFNIN